MFSVSSALSVVIVCVVVDSVGAAIPPTEETHPNVTITSEKISSMVMKAIVISISMFFFILDVDATSDSLLVSPVHTCLFVSLSLPQMLFPN